MGDAQPPRQERPRPFVVQKAAVDAQWKKLEEQRRKTQAAFAEALLQMADSRKEEQRPMTPRGAQAQLAKRGDKDSKRRESTPQHQGTRKKTSLFRLFSKKKK